MIVKDECYQYFAARATFDAYAHIAHPPPHKHAHANRKDTVCLITSAPPTSSPHKLFSNSHHDECTSFLITQLPKI